MQSSWLHDASGNPEMTAPLRMISRTFLGAIALLAGCADTSHAARRPLRPRARSPRRRRPPPSARASTAGMSVRAC